MMDHPRYELLEPIGEGLLAQVFRAHDMTVGTEVAAKILHDHVRQDSHRFAQVLDGAAAWARLGKEDQEHLVRILDIDRQRGWLVLEYLSGNLARRLLERGALPADLVRSVLQQALAGLAVIHAHDRLHGSLKPANLLITGRGRVKLGESPGIDLAAGEVPRPEGSLKYIAPEIVDPSFGALGPGADLYALGFTALELLVGPNFDELFPGVGADPVVGWMRVHTSRDERPPATRSVCPGAPADLARVIDRLLAREVGQRYASAEEALQDLEDRELVLLESEEGEPEDDGGLVPVDLEEKRTWKQWLQTPSGKWSAIAGIAALLLVGLALPFLGGDSEREPASVEINSKPEGATIFFDDQEVPDKKTNAVLPKVTPGKRRVRVALKGHKAQEKEVEFESGKKATLSFDLVPDEAEAAVRIESKPEGAELLLGERERGRTPVEVRLAPGSYPVRLKRAGFKVLDEKLVVQKGEAKLTRTFTLVPNDQLVNSTEMRFRLIPPGSFQRGSPAGEEGRVNHEGPVREVRITRPFFLGVYEVSQAEFERVMGFNPSGFTREHDGGPDFPVGGVTYEMAVAFCKKLSELPAEKAAGRVYRLPTEAEWEYACRAGTTTPFSLGTTLGEKQAAFDASISYGGARPAERSNHPHKVSAGAANPWGLYNMHGNVWEWCSDSYHPRYYAQAPDADPPGPAKGESDKRVLRGGAYNVAARFCRSAARHGDSPLATSAAYGLRVVCEVK